MSAPETISCPACNGAGETIHNDTSDGDPQCDYPIECSNCDGNGWIDSNGVDEEVDDDSEELESEHDFWERATRR